MTDRNFREPIFIMSSERSGSNLLRTLIGNHSRIADPAAAQLLNTLFNSHRYYKAIECGMSQLAKDILAIVNHPYHNWKISLDIDRLLEMNQRDSFLDMFDSIYKSYIMQHAPGKIRYVCKENGIFNFYMQLRQHFTSAKFIYLVRDVRDCVSSWMQVPLGYNTPEEAARVWYGEQLICDLLINSYQQNVLTLRYEDLVAAPEVEMSKVLNYIGEDVETGCFETDKDKGGGYAWNRFWVNLAKPVDKSRPGRFKEYFDKDTIEMIETMNKEFLCKFGYGLTTNANWNGKSSSLRLDYKKVSKNYGEGDRTELLLRDRQQLGVRINQEISKRYMEIFCKK